MKKQAWMVFPMASFLILLGAAAASAQSILLRADIPFDFLVEKQTFPAGTYTISDPGASHGVLTIKNQTPHLGIAMVRINLGMDSGRAGKGAQLLFNQYGDRYWLSQVWNGEGGQGYRIPKSRHETEFAREFAEKTGGRPQVVSLIVAGR